MINCKNCKADCSCKGTDRQIDHCGGMVELTNADRIRAMTDEELAEWLENIDTAFEEGTVVMTHGWLDWLKSPAEDVQ